MMLAVIIEAALRSLAVAAIVTVVLIGLRVRNPHALKAAWTAVLGIALTMPALMQIGAVAVLPAAPLRLPAIWVSGAAGPMVHRWRDALELVYASVALILLIRFVIALARMSGTRRHAVRITEEWIGSLDVRASGALCSPVTFGSTVLLPADYRDWSEAKRAAVLTHERAHVRQWDAWIAWGNALHGALFWFSPLAWWLRRELPALAERTSDEAVLRAGTDPADYAAVLLEFARERSRSGLAPAMSSGSVAQRLEWVLSAAPASAALCARQNALVAALLLPLALLAAVLHPGVATPLARVAAIRQPLPADASGTHARQVAILSLPDLHPYYPKDAKLAHVSGVVRVAVTLDAASRVAGVRVLSEAPAGLGFGSAASSLAYDARYDNPTGHTTTVSFNIKFAWRAGPLSNPARRQ